MSSDNDKQIADFLFRKTLEDVVRNLHISIEGLTRDQFIEVLKQAILSGDFQRQITPMVFIPQGASLDDHRIHIPIQQQVTYIPGRENQRLKDSLYKASQLLDIAVNTLEQIKNFEQSTDRGTYFTINFINPALENMEKIAEDIEHDD